MPPATLGMLERVRRQNSQQGWEAQWIAGYKPVRFSGPFGGFSSYHSVDVIPQVPNKRGITKSPSLLNTYAWPFGSITSFPGHANLNSVAGNSSKAITGITFLGEISQTLVIAIQNKIGKDVAGTWTDITGAASITDDDDNLVSFGYLNGTLVLSFFKKDAPLKWTGSGDVATLGGSPRSGIKFCLSFDGRMWLFSDQNADYSAINDPESYDLTDDTLNFLTTTGEGASDGSIMTSATVIGDSIYIGKGGPNAIVEHVFRIYRTGNPALPYRFERIETGGIGPISNAATVAVGQDLIFLAKDGNVYLVRGNLFVPEGIGRSIQRTLLADYNKSRFEFASMGLLRERGMVGLSLSLSGNTTHNRTWWYDYLNSQPGDESKEFWHHGDHAINAWGERISSGQRQLITGGYDGFYEQQLSGDTYAGSAYTKRWAGPWHLLGDPFQWYEVLGIAVVFEPVGNFNVTFEYAKDFGQSFTTVGTFNTVGGDVLGSFILGTDTLGGEEQGVAYLEIGDEVQRIKPRFTNSNGGEPFNISSYAFLVRPIRRGLDL